MGRKLEVEMAFDVSVNKILTGVIIRNKDGLNISQRYVMGPITKRLGYRFISNEVLRRMAPVSKLKIMEYWVDENGSLKDGNFLEGVPGDFLNGTGTPIANYALVDANDINKPRTLN